MCAAHKASPVNVVDESALLKLPDDTRIDKAFRLVALGLGNLRGDFLQDRLNPLEGRIRRLLVERRKNPIGFLENFAVARAQHFTERLDRKFSIRFHAMNAFDHSFGELQESFAIAAQLAFSHHYGSSGIFKFFAEICELVEAKLLSADIGARRVEDCG